MKAFTLVELLAAIAIILILAAIAIPATVKAYHWSKRWIVGVEAHKENQLNAFLDDRTNEKWLMFWSTNQPKPWDYVE